MSDLLRLVVDLFSLVWPLRLVHQWERGVVYLFGRYAATVRPGCYVIVPWFCSVTPVSVVPHVYQTPLQTVADLSFSASLVVQVIDPYLAHNTLEKWDESVVELCAAGLSDAVRRGEGDDLKRVRRRVNRELAPHGLRLLRLRYLDYVRGAPTIRLLNSQETRK